MNSLRTVRSLALALMFPACGGPLRFADRQILWRDPDDAAIRQPRRQEAGVDWTGMRDAIFLPADRLFSLDFGVEAGNVNALDEVPDSSWYADPRRDSPQAREQPRALQPAEIAGALDAPVLPLTVVRGKVIGATPGFIAEDARRRRYAVKTDHLLWRGLATSTEVVVSRLAWACGWRVPEEQLLDLRRGDLRVSPRATTKDRWGHERPYTDADLEQLLQKTPQAADGTYQALLSAWIPGKNIGSFAWFGRRKDDPNDRVPHEDRRDLRGFGVFAAWVNDIDTFENNTLDSYVGVTGQGHVLHYQQDVGGAFGLWAALPMDAWMSRETYFQLGRFLRSLLSFGASDPAWQKAGLSQRRAELLRDYPELGFFDDQDFDPRAWHPIMDNPAFVRQTRRDRYWGAKRIIAFSETELRAAIATGHYRPAAAARLFQVLWSRRQRIARAFLGDVAPLDAFRFEGDRLCFDDLWISAGLGGAGTRYQARALPGGALAVFSAPPGHGCVAVAAQPGYQVIELRAQRPGEARPGPAVRIHIMATGAVATGAVAAGAVAAGSRVLGLER